MVDDRSSVERSRGMSAVRTKNTKPELIVRNVLHRMGYRFRLHANDLPGKPDIVLRRFKTCIFVHGCFWHQHQGCKRASLPHSNTEFWHTKFQKNIARDKLVQDQLLEKGWNVCVIWECEVKDMALLEKLLKSCLNTELSK